MALEDKRTTRHLVNSDEIKQIEEWRRMFPDRWLFIEVTREDIHDVYEGKLVATAENPMDLVEIGRSYSERGVVNLKVRGDYSEPQPAFVG